MGKGSRWQIGVRVWVLAFTLLAALPATAFGPRDPLDGRYIIVLRPTADPDLTATLFVRSTGGSVLFVYSGALKGVALQGLSSAAASLLAGDPAVLWIEPDQRMAASGTDVAGSWGLDRVDQRTRPLNLTYRYSQTGSGVRAYVLDTGIRITHSQFSGRASYGYNFIDNTPAADDGNGHGTHVAGTIGGTLAGVAKNVSLVSVRVLGNDGSGTTSSVLAGVDWVTRNAIRPAVVNMSLGGPSSPSLDLAVSNSIAGGLTYCVAAGNDGQDAGLFSPSRVPAAVTVGAVDSNDAEAAFSNWGPSVKLLAPGVNNVSTSSSSDTAVAVMSGTSMASPHVAGAVALYLELNPLAPPDRVLAALRETATPDVIGGMANPATPNLLLYTLGFSEGSSQEEPPSNPAEAAGASQSLEAGGHSSLGCGCLGVEGLLLLWSLRALRRRPARDLSPAPPGTPLQLMTNDLRVDFDTRVLC